MGLEKNEDKIEDGAEFGIEIASLMRTLIEVYNVKEGDVESWHKSGIFDNMEEGESKEMEYEGRKFTVSRKHGFKVEGESQKD